MNVWQLKLVLCSLLMLGCSLASEPEFSAQYRAQELVDLGTMHLRRGDLDRAAAAYQTAYETGRIAAALDGLGAAAFLGGQYVEAQRYFVQAYDLDPEYGEALSNLALLYDAAGFKLEAAELYQRALRLAPGNARARNNFAMLLQSAGASNAKVRGELLKAEALAQAPLIKENIRQIEERGL